MHSDTSGIRGATAAAGRYVFIGENFWPNTESHLDVIDVSAPANPQRVARCSISGQYRDVVLKAHTPSSRLVMACA